MVNWHDYVSLQECTVYQYIYHLTISKALFPHVPDSDLQFSSKTGHFFAEKTTISDSFSPKKTRLNPQNFFGGFGVINSSFLFHIFIDHKSKRAF